MPTLTRNPALSSKWRGAIAILALVFGGMTLVSGGSVLFGGAEVRTLAGDVVPVVLWVNFLAGFAYIVAGVGIWTRAGWAFPLAVLIAVVTLAAALFFTIAVLTGTAFEMRTVGALALRFAIWAGIALMIRPRRAQP